MPVKENLKKKKQKNCRLTKINKKKSFSSHFLLFLLLFLL